MNSRQTMLDRLRSRVVDQVELPSLEGPWLEFADRTAQYEEVLRFVGGQTTRCPDRATAQRRIEELFADRKPKRIVSLCPDLFAGNVNVEQIDDPHSLADVDLVIDQAGFGVAENGAVWLDDRRLKHRAIYFITQHLILLVSAAEIVNNMHEAYRRIQITGPQFGLFLSGPSKTADIEQSLVLGAHGSRTLEVLIVP